MRTWPYMFAWHSFPLSSLVSRAVGACSWSRTDAAFPEVSFSCCSGLSRMWLRRKLLQPRARAGFNGDHVGPGRADRIVRP